MITIVTLLTVIILVMVAATRLKIHPFLLLLSAAIFTGFAVGLKAELVLEVIAEGFGNALGTIGIVIACGSVIGTFLQNSGGAQRMAQWFLRFVSDKKSPIAMNITGYLVSIPVYCDSGFVILSSLNRAISRRTKISLAVLAVALGSGLYSTHVFVPPTPGPLAAATNLGADIGMVLLLGMVVAIPTALAGLLWAKLYCRRFSIVPSEKVRTSDEPFLPEELKTATPYMPGAFRSFAPLVVPLLLMAVKSVSDIPSIPLGHGLFNEVLGFLGNPIIALVIGVFLAFLLPESIKAEVLLNWVTEGLKNAGVIVLIIGAGAAFGNVLKATQLADYLGKLLSSWHIGIFLPFLIAAAIKTAQGSSTVSMITTSAITAPLLLPMGFESPIERVLVVLAIGAGSMIVSHANDSYFWVVSQFSDMDTSTAMRCHTIATLIQGLVGIGIIAVLTYLLA